MPEGLGRKVAVEKLRDIGALVDLVATMPHKDPRYALFLGAGASLSSGIPTAERLVLQWQRRLFLGRTGRSRWLPQYEEAKRKWIAEEYPKWRRKWEDEFGRQPSDYSALFSYMCPDIGARQGYIEQLISDCEPGPGYIYLTSLVLGGYFHTFITTNFDDLIHDSLFRYGGLKPAVAAFDSQVDSLRLQGPRPKIIKLHGDFLYDNIRSVGSELGRLGRNMEEKLERTCENYGLIVIGYSGQDLSVMAPLRTLLHRRDKLKHGLHWCLFTPEAKDADGNFQRINTIEIPDELASMHDSYPEKLHLYAAPSFDDLMGAFYTRCNCQPPSELAHPEAKALYARLRDGLENADQAWRLSPEFSELLRGFRKAVSNPIPKAMMLLDEADEKHREGGRDVKRNHFSKARAAFQEAISLATEAKKTADEFQKIRVFRRLSGTHTSLIDALAKQKDLARFADLEDSDQRSQYLKLAHEALSETREGLTWDARAASPSELRGHRLNLWFNGLISFGYLRELDSAFFKENRAEAASWLERMMSDPFLGDEMVELLEDEIGGKALLEDLRRDPDQEDEPTEQQS